MSFTKVAPAGIGTSPGTSIRIGDSLLHSTGLDIGTGSGIGVTIRQHGNATFTGIITAASFSGKATELATNATGTNLTLSGNLGVGGVLTYEDVTNVDSVGLITARGGINVTGGNITLGDSGGATDDRIVLGAGSDLSIMHDGTESTILSSTGGLVIKDTGGYMRLRSNELKIQSTANETYIEADANGAVQLFHNDSKKLETTATGAIITGIATATTFSGSGANLTNLDASDLASGTIPDARFPAVLPSVSGVNLTGVSGFSTALGNTQGTLENLVFKTTESFTIGAGQSVRLESDNISGNTLFTRLGRINVSTGATFHVAAGTTFVMNVLDVF